MIGNTRSFVYLSITVPPDQIDVNVHPTKMEVKMVQEDELVVMLRDAIQKQLSLKSSSRTFSISAPPERPPDIQSSNPSHYIRTDSRDQTIESMFHKHKIRRLSTETVIAYAPTIGDAPVIPSNSLNAWTKAMETSFKNILERSGRRPPLIVVERLISEHERSLDAVTGTVDVCTSVYVGSVSDDLKMVLIQIKTALYGLDMHAALREYVMGACLYNFGCHGRMTIDLEHSVGCKLSPTVVSRSPMLLEYFSIDVSGMFLIER